MALVDGLEVGEHAAEPTMVDEGHARARAAASWIAAWSLLLGTDEEDRSAVCADVLRAILIGLLGCFERLP